jgi:hypothetical protein
LDEIGAAAVPLGLTVQREGSDAEPALRIDDQPLDLELIERAHPHPGVIRQLIADSQAPAMLVADRISDSGRDLLRSAGWSWYDRRGHLRLWVPGLRIETDVDAGSSARVRRSSNPWTTVGLEIALHSLCDPTEAVTARRVARVIGRSVGTTHELIGNFTEQGLVGPSTRLPLLPDLFWETADHWPDDGWTAVPESIETVADELGPNALVRVDERAATRGGARIPAAGDLPARCYVTDKGQLRRVRALADNDRPDRTFVRLAPVQWLPHLDGFEPDDAHPWFVAHPIVCALRLATDPARGREIVESWGIVPGLEP